MDQQPDVFQRCSRCGFPLRPGAAGLRYFGTSVAHRQSECLELLRAEIYRLGARVLELEAQCEAGAASETRWLEWLTAKGLLHFHPICTRPDGSNGPAWVLRAPWVINGDSCEAWHPDSAAAALRAFLTS